MASTDEANLCLCHSSDHRARPVYQYSGKGLGPMDRYLAEGTSVVPHQSYFTPPTDTRGKKAEKTPADVNADHCGRYDRRE